MLFYNNFNDLFNSQCGYSFCSHGVFDVQVSNGLADISEFLRVANGFPEGTPDMTSGNSNLNVEKLHYILKTYTPKDAKRYENELNIIRDDTSSLFHSVFGQNIKLADAPPEKIGKALDSIKKQLDKWKDERNPDYQEKIKDYNALDELFRGLFNISETIKVVSLVFDLPDVKNQWPDFYSKLKECRTAEEYTKLIVATIRSGLRLEKKGYNREAIEKITYKNNKPINQEYVDKLIDNAVTYSEKMVRLLDSFDSFGFQWTPERQWYTNDENFPEELVSCANMLFGNTLAKAVLNCEPMGYDLKRQYEMDLRKLFANQINDRFGERVRKYGYTKDNDHKEKDHKSTGKGVIAFWEFICEGDQSQENMNEILKVISVHIQHSYPGMLEDYVIDDDANKAIDGDSNYGNDEVGRLNYLFNMYNKNRYKKLKFTKQFEDQRRCKHK